MTLNKAIFTKNRPGLEQELHVKRTQQGKIQYLIIYAIEQEGLTLEKDVRDFVTKASFVFEVVSKSRFFDEWGKARKELIETGRISLKPSELTSIQIPLESELKVVVEELKKARENKKFAKVFRILEELLFLSNKRHISHEEGVLKEIFEILNDSSLFTNKEVIFYTISTLGEIELYLSKNKPKKYEKILDDINEKHIKLICRKIKKLDDVEIIKYILELLFGYTNSEEVVYTIFELVEDMDDKKYQVISYLILKILFFVPEKDSIYEQKKFILFDNFEDLIRKEIFRLMEHENPIVRDRAAILNANRRERYA